MNSKKRTMGEDIREAILKYIKSGRDPLDKIIGQKGAKKKTL